MAQQLHVEFETGYRRILVERAEPEGCRREVWEFSTYAAESARLILQAYDRQSRPSRRHKWRPSTGQGWMYQRLEPRYRQAQGRGRAPAGRSGRGGQAGFREQARGHPLTGRQLEPHAAAASRPAATSS
jgi:hypothetical protein